MDDIGQISNLHPIDPIITPVYGYYLHHETFGGRWEEAIVTIQVKFPITLNFPKFSISPKALCCFHLC